tara:strand:+ start:69 stop:497 length:429 start_codon:yes stop_codon:yes gene_type:complete
MNLKVIKYKNYGCTMESEEDETPYGNKFFWSFFELNNGKIIVLNYIENLKNNRVISNSYEFSYANYELKSGKFINYEFGNTKAINKKEMHKEFYDWFDSNPIAKDIKELKFPSKNEKKCVKEFFIKNIRKTKGVSTNTIIYG